MGDLQCPVRLHLLGPGEEPAPDRIAVVVDLAGSDAAAVLTEVDDLADRYRGEAVVVQVSEEVRRRVAVLLVADADARLLEGGADGWVPRRPDHHEDR